MRQLREQPEEFRSVELKLSKPCTFGGLEHSVTSRTECLHFACRKRCISNGAQVRNPSVLINEAIGTIEARNEHSCNAAEREGNFNFANDRRRKSSPFASEQLCEERLWIVHAILVGRDHTFS